MARRGYGHPLGGRKSGPGYAGSAVEKPHKHTLPMGMQFSTPANDRKCVPHRVDEQVACAVGDCQHTFGMYCRDCDRVV
jgi:hypothetical protein